MVNVKVLYYVRALLLFISCSECARDLFARCSKTIQLPMESLEATTMVVLSKIILYFNVIHVPFSYISFTMIWRCATHWVQKQVYTNWVSTWNGLPYHSCYTHVYTGVFYYSIGNLPPMLLSCLHSIQLVAIVKTKFVEKYGIDKILEPFVHDLKELEKVNII